MAVTLSLYNHTARRFADGANAVGDTYKVMLCTAATFDAADTTLAGVTKTEVATANGYTAGGAALTNVVVTTVSTDGARLDADDATWTASGGTIVASFGILYNDTDADDPPVAFIDFGGSQTAGDGTDFKVVWSATGIINWTVTV
jgi:hypothetical protein